MAACVIFMPDVPLVSVSLWRELLAACCCCLFVKPSAPVIQCLWPEMYLFLANLMGLHGGSDPPQDSVPQLLDPARDITLYMTQKGENAAKSWTTRIRPKWLAHSLIPIFSGVYSGCRIARPNRW